jgi:PAS domain S-box-containing protein
VALILALTAMGFVVARALAARDARRDSERRAEVAAAQIRGRVEEATTLTESLRRSMQDEGGTGVTNDQFVRNALRWLSPAELPAAAWVEQVGQADRAAYERRTGRAIVTPDARRRVVPLSRAYLPATLVSGYPPMDLRGADLRREPGIAAALQRAIAPEVAATPVARRVNGRSGLFLVASAPNLIDGVLEAGAVVVFVAEATLRGAAGNPAGLRLAAAADRGGRNTVRRKFTVAGQQFGVVLPKDSVNGPAALLPWIILAAGLVLAGLAGALGVVGARRSTAKAEIDRLFTLSSDLITVAGFDGFLRRINPASEQRLGYTERELLARPFLDFVHPDDRERTAAALRSIVAGERRIAFVNRLLCKDGSDKWFEWTATPVPEERTIYGVGRDVTERRQAEREVGRLADEQAALRRVATLVAEEAAQAEIFAAIAEETAQLLGASAVRVVRYDREESGLVLAGSGEEDVTPSGFRFPLDGETVAARVFRKGRSTRVDDYSDVSGPIGESAREHGIRSVVGVPVVVDGQLWGAVTAGTAEDAGLSPDTESRLGQFTELMATAISNTEARAEVERLAQEQAALRRVATLVAQGVRPADLVSAVSHEVSRLFGTGAAVLKFEHDPPGIVFVGTSEELGIPVSTRSWELQDEMASAEVYRTGRPARVDLRDWSSLTGPVAAAGRRLLIISTVVSPIVVEGRLWGAMSVVSRSEVLPIGFEERLAKFTELVATAIANAESKSELAASRMRIVAASDETRRRIERDLHDGTQQRLVSLALATRVAEAQAPAGDAQLRDTLSGIASGLQDAVRDLRELSRGIHPAILSEGGIGPALKSLARRSAIPVEVDAPRDARFPEPIEVAAYFVASEALANATKHAQASYVRVSAAQRNGSLQLSIRDNGVGGADPAHGSGLVGLADRVDALGGSLRVRSHPGDGTEITAEFPLELEPGQDQADA